MCQPTNNYAWHLKEKIMTVHIPAQVPFIAFDGEATGLNIGPIIKGKPSQAFEFTFALLHPDTWEVEDILFQRCQYHPKWYDWSTDAEKIHGTKPEELNKEPSMIDAGAKVLHWLRTHTPKDAKYPRPQTLTHNGVTDHAWLEHWFHRAGYSKGKEWDFHHRRVDAYTMCAMHLGFGNSQDQFILMNYPRGAHSSLEDVLVMVHACKLAKWDFTKLREENPTFKTKDLIRAKAAECPEFEKALTKEREALLEDIRKFKHLDPSLADKEV